MKIHLIQYSVNSCFFIHFTHIGDIQNNVVAMNWPISSKPFEKEGCHLNTKEKCTGYFIMFIREQPRKV